MDSIEQKVNSPEILFTEERYTDLGYFNRFLLWVVSPLIFVVTSFWLYGWLPILRAVIPGDGDDVLVENLKRKYNIKKVAVDRAVYSIIGSKWKMWFCANWSLMVIPIILIIAFEHQVIVNIAIIFLVFSLLSFAFVFMTVFDEARELHMIENINSYSTNNDVEEGILVVGGSHSHRLIELAEYFPNIDEVEEV